jgi:L-amino acid N-acyltransferase YncA
MIRDAAERDATAIRAIYAPHVIETAVSFELHPPSVGEMARRISAAEPDFPWLVSEIEGELLGYAYAGPFRTRPAYRFSVEIAVYVRTGATGRGIGRELIEALLADLQRRGYAQAFAGIAAPERGQRETVRSLRLCPRRNVQGRRLQAREMARRWLVAEGDRRSRFVLVT